MKLPPYPLSTSGSPPNPSYINAWYEMLRFLLNDGGIAVNVDHNDLNGLQGGGSGDFYHLSSGQYSDLTGGGNSTEHYHDSDRARANHTGVQALVTVNDPIFYGAVGDGVTDDTTAINDMLADVDEAQWGSNNYLVTGNLVGFHDIAKYGSGSITRGSDTFYITPLLAQTNKLYVATTGSDNNDGLTAAFPFATIQKALNVLAEYAPALPGRWQIILAAGTYTETLILDSATRSEYPVIIDGPAVGGHPNVPTAIIEPAAASNTILTVSEGRGWYLIRNVLFQDATTGTALNLNGSVRVGLTNTHINNCKIGIINQHGSMLTALGGIWTGVGRGTAGGIGLFSTYGSTHAFSGSGASDGVQVSGFETGLLVTEGAQGHLDGIQISDCENGLALRRGSGSCNTDNMAIDDCSIGVKTSEPWFNNAIAFGATTANTLDVESRGDAPEFDFCAQDYEVHTERLVESDYGISHTGTVVATQVYQFANIRTWMIGEGGHTARLKLFFSQAALAGTCSVQVFLYDGTTEDFISGVTLPVGTEEAVLESQIHFSSGIAQRGMTWGTYKTAGAQGGLCGTLGTGALDTRHTNIWIRVKLQLSNAADTATINWLEVYGTFAG